MRRLVANIRSFFSRAGARYHALGIGGLNKWIALAGLLVIISLVVALRDAKDLEWQDFQKDYYRLAAANAKTEAQGEWARAQQLQIKQYYLPDLGRIERCATCHLAVENPGAEDAVEPFRRHSPLLESHPPEQFGCASCHRGEPRGVATLEAHGEEGGGSRRLLRGDYMQAACYTCHGEKTLPPEATAAVIEGRNLFNRYKCLRCHQIDGVGGNEGPDLSDVGSRRDWVWTYAHTVNPQAMTLDSTMPRFALTRDEIKYISVYLLTLVEHRDRYDQAQYIAKGGPEAADKWEEYKGWLEQQAEEPAATDGFSYDGKELFKGAACNNCHTIGRRGGEVGPPLTRIGGKREREWLEDLLKDPALVAPDGVMPQLYLNQREIDALVDYLAGLK